MCFYFLNNFILKKKYEFYLETFNIKYKENSILFLFIFTIRILFRLKIDISKFNF